MPRPVKTPLKQVVPRFNEGSVAVYFAAKLEHSDDWYVLGANTGTKATYLTLFQGEFSKERAEEYRDYKNQNKCLIGENFLIDHL